MVDIGKYSEKSHLIDKELAKVFPRSIPNLHDAAWYHLETGGKRLRPLLAIMTCEALGGDVEKIMPFAAACEVLHNWCLIHDDIMDSDRIRRDRQTVWVKYGVPHAINVGDWMAQKVYELILSSKERGLDDNSTIRLMDIMVQTTLRTAEGQTMDINLRNNDSPTEEDYLEMVTGKTAHYLTVPMLGAAIVAGRDELIPGLVEFGKNLGPAFQIADDILDLTEGKGRGEIGRDIKEGKRSILVVHCLSKCNGDERDMLISILNKTPEETTYDDVLYAKALFEKYGSVDYAKSRAEYFSDKAKKIAGTMPEDLKEILNFFADYVISRRK